MHIPPAEAVLPSLASFVLVPVLRMLVGFFQRRDSSPPAQPEGPRSRLNRWELNLHQRRWGLNLKYESHLADGCGPSLGPRRGVKLVCMDWCYKPLTADSQLRAREAEQNGALELFQGYCECNTLVGAVRKPHMDGPQGGPLHPTAHREPKPRKSRGNGKRTGSK